MASHRHHQGSPVSPASGLLDVFCERAIVGLVLVILVYSVLAWAAMRETEFAVVQWLSSLVVIVWAARIWANRSLRLFWPPICWAVLAFFVYAIIRYFYSEIEYPARKELNHVIVYGVLFFAIINNVNRREATTFIALSLIVLGVALTIVAAFQFVGHKPPRIWNMLRPQVYALRGSGTFICPNHFAGFLEMLIPVALAYALMGRFKPTIKVVIAYAGLILLAGLGLSISRGGLVAAAISLAILLFVLLFQRDYRLRAAIMLAVMVCVAAGIGATQASKFNKRFALVKNDLSLRDELWHSAYELYKTEPVWGAGLGHYDHKFWVHRSNPKHFVQPQYAHNDYLQTLCEMGTVGMAIIACAMALLAVGVFKTWRFVRKDPQELGAKDSTKAAFLLGATFGLISMLIHEITDFHMHVPANALLAVTWMALLSVQLRFATDDYWFNPRLLGRVIATLLFAGSTYWFVEQGWKGYFEGTALNDAFDELKWTERKVDAYRRALVVEPRNPKTLAYLGEGLRVLGIDELPEKKDRSEEALTVLQKAMEVDPHYPLVPMWYATCLDALGRTNESLPFYDRACALDPIGHRPLFYRGRHYMITEDYKTAMIDLRKAQDRYYDQVAEDYFWMASARIKRLESVNPKPKSP